MLQYGSAQPARMFDITPGAVLLNTHTGQPQSCTVYRPTASYAVVWSECCLWEGYPSQVLRCQLAKQQSQAWLRTLSCVTEHKSGKNSCLVCTELFCSVACQVYLVTHVAPALPD